MSEYPASANISASLRVDTVIGPAVTSRATSMLFAVFRCGLSRTPGKRARCVRIRSRLRSSLARSSSSAGVSRSARCKGDFLRLAWRDRADVAILAALLAAPLPSYRHHRRSEEHTSELQSLMRISYAVFCLKKKKHNNTKTNNAQ